MKIKQYKGLKAVKKVAPVTEADVMKELENIRRQRTQSVPVEDRPAALGDEVIIDYAGFVGDYQFPGGTAEKQPLTLGSGMFIPGFEEQLVGANVGDQVDVNVTFPEVYHSAELAGKEAVFHCTVHEINEKRECQLDDEFARMFVGIESLEQMKQQLKAQMEEYAQLMAQNQVRDDLLKVLVEQIEEFDAEEALVENEIRIALDGFKQQLQQQGMEFANWLKLTGRTEEQVHADLRPQAIATLKARVALEEICRLENITVSEEEIDAAYEEVSKRYGMTAKQLRDTFGADNDDKVRKDICMKKAIAFLESCADITEA